MRLPLGAKILGAFGIIVFLALGITVGAGNRFARSEYNAFAARRDWERARSMAPFFSLWTKEAARAVSRGLEPEIAELGSFLLEDHQDHHGQMMRRRPGQGPPPHQSDWPDRQDREDRGGAEIFDRLLITDVHGQVLFNTTRLRDERYPRVGEQPRGIEVRNNAEIVGYLYVGQMLPGPPQPGEDSFFRDAGMRTVVFTALVFLAAIFLGLLLTRHIVVPVKVLNAAARRVEEGALDVRVPDRRQDEMGDLARGFNAMTASLEAADRQRRQFIADSAHEIRTPVSLIRTRIEMMEEGVYPMDAESLGALAEETDRLVGLIEELKTLATLESLDFSMNTVSVNLAELAEKVVESSRPAIAQSSLSVETEITDTHPVISGNAEKLHRLVKNLLSNALRHADSRVRIVIGPGYPDRIAIHVEDDGPGIPEAMRERVFERFYRMDSSRSRDLGGTGLGLAICREIVKAHGGEISIGASRKLGGAVFLVTLPRDDQRGYSRSSKQRA